MGQRNTTLTMQKRLRSPFSHRSSKGNLSATFTVPDDDEHKVELLNVNAATEEELMTLPGITRHVAHNIVEHRKAIGRFKKVEDLALVKGVGADKLSHLRPEVCVNKRRNNQSCASSRAQSLDSIDSRTTLYRSSKLIDVNRANVFELQCVHGLTQELAANIVYYRTKKGPFKQLDDLIRVKSMDQVRLGNVRPFLTVGRECDSDGLLINNNNNEVGRPNGILKPMSPMMQQQQQQHRKSPSAPAKLSYGKGLSNSSLEDVFELLSTYSSRPVIEDDFHYVRNGEKAIKIASWNLQEFTYEKVCNLGVREVVCRTILENKWSIVALQDVCSIEALKMLCDELNKPRLRRVSEWKNNSHQWHYCYYNIEHFRVSFLYDLSSGGIEISLNSLDEIVVEKHIGLLADFKLNDINLTILNVDCFMYNLFGIEEKVAKTLQITDPQVFVAGTFVHSPKDLNDSRHILGLSAVIPMSTNTKLVNGRTLPALNVLDNILANAGALAHLTGIWGVVRQGLHHLAIPCGWNWGGPVSIHCPVWAEVYVSPNIGTAL